MGTMSHYFVLCWCFCSWLLINISIGEKDAEKHMVTSGNQIGDQPWSEVRHLRDVCKCTPCKTGPECNESIEDLSPKFSQLFTFVEVNEENYKYYLPLRYNYTTYPGGGPKCPCKVFQYEITEVEDVMEPDNPDKDHTFDIDSDTGIIRLGRDKEISFADMYRLNIRVRNSRTNASDETKLTVARQKHFDNVLDQYSPLASNGYDMEILSEHVIHKRSIAATDVAFNLTQLTNVSEIRIGSRVKFQLDVVFPAQSVDMSVELFTPDDTTVMILCDVQVAAVGSNLNYTGNAAVVYDSKDPLNILVKPDRAIIDFGIVSNNQVNTDNSSSTIRIFYEAVMIDDLNAQNGTFWVSAGAEYQNETFIWVGQASFTAVVDGNMTVSKDPIFNVTMPTSIALGSSVIVTVDMYMPFPTRNYVFKAYVPSDTIGVMSICEIWFGHFGQNFVCGNNPSNIKNKTVPDPQAIGNAIGELDLGKLLNKGSRDNIAVGESDVVSLQYILHMYPDTTKIGYVMSVGLALEVDTNIIWIGSSNFTVAPIANNFILPLLNNVSTDLASGQSTVGQPFSIIYFIKIPNSSDASNYVLELLAPKDTQPIFSVCSFEVLFVGRNMPCIDKDELVTTYSSSFASGNYEPDMATIDLGYVTNMARSGSSDENFISIKAILKPLNRSFTLPQDYVVNFGVNRNGVHMTISNFTVSVVNTTVVTPITNITAPQFYMEFYDSNSSVEVRGSTKVIINMKTARNITYPEMDMEFLMPTSTDHAYCHVCRVDIVSSGKNMPCMTPEWYNTKMRYYSRYDSLIMDGAQLNFGGMCNRQNEDSEFEDNTTFAVYLKVLADISNLSSSWISAGLLYSSNNLWVGQLELNSKRTGTNYAPFSSTYGALQLNSTNAPVPLGLTVSYSILFKMAPGDTADMKVIATALQEGLHICAVRLHAAGSNFPCASGALNSSNLYWPSKSGYSQYTLDMGLVKNFGDTTTNMTANNFFDSNSLIIEVVTRANPANQAGSYGMNILVHEDTQMLHPHNWTVTIDTTENFTGVSQIATANVTWNLTVGEITGGDNISDVAIGETKRVLLTAVIPEGSTYRLKFSFIILPMVVGKLEICDAAIAFVGDNLPCIDSLMKPDMTSTDTIYNETASFDLGYTCSRVASPGDEMANTVIFEAYIRVVPNGNAVVGETLTVTGNVDVFSAPTDVNSLVFTVTDPAAFQDRAINMSGVSNDTFKALNISDPLTMKIAENRTIPIFVTVPRNSVSRLLIDIEMPTNQSACLTVNDIRVQGSVGENVLCATPSTNNKGVVYKKNFNDTLDNGQNNYAYLDLGIVTNTGKTYRQKVYMLGDDDIAFEADIQMADCVANENMTIHKMGIGIKVANSIFLYNHDIQVIRDSIEKPDIMAEVLINSSSSSSVLYIDGIVYHTVHSTAEGVGTSIVLYLPVYQIAPTSFIHASKNCTIISDSSRPSVLEIKCDRFFFADIFTFTVQVSINTSVVLPSGFSAGTSVAQCIVGTDFLVRNATQYVLADWYPYATSAEQVLSFSVTAGLPTGCLQPLGLGNGSILNCQIVSSSDNLGSTLPDFGRLNHVNAWVPYVRNGEAARNRYFIVYLGNTYKINQIDIQQDTGHPVKVTTITVDYTMDARSWFGDEIINFGPSPSTLETKLLSGTEARGIRITISNDTANCVQSYVGLKFELYGCKKTNNVTVNDTCAILANTVVQPPIDFSYRNFVVGSTSVFVCDRNVKRKLYFGSCMKSVNLSNRWQELDPRIASLIGYENSQQRLYAYGQNMNSILMSVDDGATWQAIQANQELAADKLLSSWVPARMVPEDNNANLIQTLPHFTYTMGTWGATYDGMYENNVLKTNWSSIL